MTIEKFIDVDLRITLGDRLLCPRTQIRVEPGTIASLTGSSGSGKTSILLALLGELAEGAAAEGYARVGEYEPLKLSGEALRAYRYEQVAFIGQDPGAELNPLMSVAQLLAELSPQADAAKALASVGMDPSFLNRRIHALSGGQQRRIGLLRALLKDPAVLLLDEPFAGLDSLTGGTVASLLQEAAAGGTTILLTGHDEARLSALTNQRIRIGDAVNPQVKALNTDAAPEVDKTTTDIAVDFINATVETAGGAPIIHDWSYQIPRGSLTALLGASGSGKSSLLKTLLGMHPMRSGDIRVLGCSVNAARAWKNPTVQYVPQDPLSTLNPVLSARRSVARTLKLRKPALGRNEAEKELIRLLTSMGLEENLHSHRPKTLSGGQRQRVALARALAPNPQVILCDEVTAALDAVTGDAIMRILRELADQGATIIFATHDEPLAKRYCDMVIRLGETLHDSRKNRSAASRT